MNNKKSSIAYHLKELKRRLIYTLIVFLISFLASYYYVEEIYKFLLTPLLNVWESKDRTMIYTNLAEIFFSYLKLAYYASMAFTLPFLVCQIYLFIAPGLYKKEKRSILPFLIASPILFFIGGLFVYYCIFPLAWNFFLGFENTYYAEQIPMKLEAKVSEYLIIVINMIIAFGIAFQLPILLALLTRIGIIDDTILKEKRRYAVVFIFIIAAILTPPDAISQIGLAIPMLILYEVSILIAKKIKKGKKKCTT